MSATKLSSTQITRLLPRFEEELGKADRQRIAQLLPLLQGETLNYAIALNALFPGDDQQKSQNDFRAFRNRINSAAQEAGVAFKLEADSNKRSPPQQRECWFEGEDSKVADIERYSAEEASDGDSANIVPARGRPLDGKRTIKLFVSYARKDNENGDVDSFLEKFEEYARVYAGEYRFQIWADWHITIGQAWNREIQDALEKCHFGLLFLSISFLDRQYIQKHELPQLLATERALPIGFKKLDLHKADLLGVKERQVFRLKDRQRFYSECRGEDKRGDFFSELITQIKARVDALPVEPPRNPPQPPFCKGGSEEVECVDYVERISQRMWVEADKGFDRNHMHSKARATSIQNVQSLIDKGEVHHGGEGIIATEYLLEWLSGKDSPAFCALLGEYGMGKTTTCKALTRELLERRKTDKSLPLPIYVDLREYTWDKRVDFTLADILDHILKKSWKGGQLDVGVKPEDIIQQVQTNRALMIWDGLDEVINHMSSKLANDFIRQLWRVLPPLKQDKTQHPDAGKMLISCRSHYFRNVQEQNAMLTSEHRDGIKGQDYQALILLPFGEEQIETYLSKSLRLDKDKLQGVLELIRSVHNLPEMAERPYTLSLIAQHIPQIEQLSLRGETIQGVTLYQSMVNSWLSRDTGKHQFSPQHKKQLMEYLAAALWKSGQRQWNVDDLDEWLDDFLYENPKLASAYKSLDHTVLKEDLRTATFIVRPDDEHFRFAHTSLQEFFLASYLHRALHNDDRSVWQFLPPSPLAGDGMGMGGILPSLETLDFLVQLFIGKRDKRSRCEQHLSAWLAEHDPQSSKLVFDVWLLLAKHGEVVPYQCMALAGEDLFQWEIKGTKDKHLQLHDVDWQGARLEPMIFDYVEFCNCNFNQAQLRQSEFQHCSFRQCRMENADLTASLWRNNNLHSLDVSSCQLEHSQWVRNQGRTWATATPLAYNQRTDQYIPTNVWVHLNVGHGGRVECIAFSPDGSKLASGSFDNTVKLWDVVSGECVKTFTQHTSAVMSVTFSPDGGKLASCSDDNTVKLWDVVSGGCLKTFTQHTSVVNSVTFSPDGSKLASCSDDNTVKLWDVVSGECLKTMVSISKDIEPRYPHQSLLQRMSSYYSRQGVAQVVFSLDGEKLVSRSLNNTVELWDIVSDKCLKVFVPHQGRIKTVTFALDGRKLAAYLSDGTIEFWDMISGECVRTLTQHTSAVNYLKSVTFSPDGNKLAFTRLIPNNTVELWNIGSAKHRQIFELYTGSVQSVTFSPDGSQLAFGSSDNIVELHSLVSGEYLRTFDRHKGSVRSVTFSPDGSKLVSASEDETVKLWDIATGACLKTFAGHAHFVTSVKFSPDGNKLASGSSDNTVKLWDVESGECSKTFDQRRDSVQSVTFSPDGSKLASSLSGGTVTLWDIISGKYLRAFYHRLEPSQRGRSQESQSLLSVVFSPDGSKLASCSSSKTVKLWDLESRKCLKTFSQNTQEVNSVMFNRDGGKLISGSSDNTVKLWDVESGECLKTFDQHQGKVWSVTFSPDESKLASGSSDNTVKLWDVASGECLKTFAQHQGCVNSVTFSPDGSKLASGSSDNTVKLWDVASGECLKTHYHLPSGNAATLDEKTGRIVYGSAEAWRWLRYREVLDSGETILHPAEIFGALPGSE